MAMFRGVNTGHFHRNINKIKEVGSTQREEFFIQQK